LECDGVVKEELRSGFEDIRDGIFREILIEGRGEIAEDETNVFDWDLEGGSGQKESASSVPIVMREMVLLTTTTMEVIDLMYFSTRVVTLFMWSLSC